MNMTEDLKHQIHVFVPGPELLTTCQYMHIHVHVMHTRYLLCLSYKTFTLFAQCLSDITLSSKYLVKNTNSFSYRLKLSLLEFYVVHVLISFRFTHVFAMIKVCTCKYPQTC